MSFRKLKKFVDANGRLPVEDMPRVGIRARSAEGFVGRPQGLTVVAPVLSTQDLQTIFA